MTNTLPLSGDLFAYSAPARLYTVHIFDLDGTVYQGESLLPTAGPTMRFPAEPSDIIRRLGDLLSHQATHSGIS